MTPDLRLKCLGTLEMYPTRYSYTLETSEDKTTLETSEDKTTLETSEDEYDRFRFLYLHLVFETPSIMVFQAKYMTTSTGRNERI